MGMTDLVSNEEESKEEMLEKTPMSMGDPVVALAAGSVLFSWYQFYVKGDTENGIFVGLWAPTLLAASNYIQQKDVIRRVREGLASL